ncbi:hypothetical protein NDN08_003403 [Rhodosorus marinus]|uniref:Thioredoxin domain-containing protein n=1 Tax=Rhodosorus marinus TaxID=101924 RepID=A0AAV8UWI2_9RHOD|nr:hypothetical protein NDN08_003403 [Rhodosorus marinus]
MSSVRILRSASEIFERSVKLSGGSRRFAKFKRMKNLNSVWPDRKYQAANMPFIQVDIDNFKTEVLAAKKPVVLDAYAEWCAPCGTTEKNVKRAVLGTRGKVLLARFNVDHSPNLAAMIGVKGVPTVIVYYLGSEMIRDVGTDTVTKYINMVNWALSLDNTHDVIPPP